MAGWSIDLTGDVALNKKIDELEKGINRWMINRAFKPASEMFIDPTIRRINHVKHRLGNRRTMRAGAMRKSRKMMGTRFISKFGTTDPKNDPYYGAFVNWGHRIFIHGTYTGKRTKPQRFMEKSFEEKKQQAADTAATNLKREIEAEWAKGQSRT